MGDPVARLEALFPHLGWSLGFARVNGQWEVAVW